MTKIGFLLAEDEAIKLRFSGLTVSDDRNNERPVQVFFRYPEGETEKHYPFITIESIGINHARDRQHSETDLYTNRTGPSQLTYWPSTSPEITEPPNVDYMRANEFIPIDLLYQVTTYTRSAYHDRQLTSQIMTRITPFRFNSIQVAADDTHRRFDLLSWTTADLLDEESGYRKRIFRKVYTLQMSAELPSEALLGVKQVTSVHTTIEQIND